MCALYRVCAVLGICHSLINFGLLSLTIFKEVHGNLWEQCVCQNILILLLVLCHLTLKLIKLVLQKICRAACDRLYITDTLLLNFRIKRFGCCAILTA